MKQKVNILSNGQSSSQTLLRHWLWPSINILICSMTAVGDFEGIACMLMSLMWLVCTVESSLKWVFTIYISCTSRMHVPEQKRKEKNAALVHIILLREGSNRTNQNYMNACSRNCDWWIALYIYMNIYIFLHWSRPVIKMQYMYLFVSYFI